MRHEVAKEFFVDLPGARTSGKPSRAVLDEAHEGGPGNNRIEQLAIQRISRACKAGKRNAAADFGLFDDQCTLLADAEPLAQLGSGHPDGIADDTDPADGGWGEQMAGAAQGFKALVESSTRGQPVLVLHGNKHKPTYMLVFDVPAETRVPGLSCPESIPVSE